MKKLLLAIATLYLFALTTHAQEGVSQYFDDGGRSEKNRLLKAGIDVFNGEYSVLYEQELFKNMSIEGSLGLISISRQSSLSYNFV